MVSTVHRVAFSKLSVHVAPLSTSWRNLLPTIFVCQRCLRAFKTTVAPLAGHNKWSKTKHIKAATDKKKMAERTSIIKTITVCSRMYGEDIKYNPRLGQAIATAIKANVPKPLVQAAIARGQGRSETGARLENLTIEILLPPKIGLVADVETDKKTRTMQGLKQAVKMNGGVMSSTSFLFSKRGRVVFRSSPSGPTLAKVLEGAIELDGVQDIEERHNRFVVWTDTSSLMVIAQTLSSKFGLEIVESDIIWAPNEDTMVAVETQYSAESLDALLTSIREHPEVKAVFANIRQGAATDDAWMKVMRHIEN